MTNSAKKAGVGVSQWHRGQKADFLAILRQTSHDIDSLYISQFGHYPLFSPKLGRVSTLKEEVTRWW